MGGRGDSRIPVHTCKVQAHYELGNLNLNRDIKPSILSSTDQQIGIKLAALRHSTILLIGLRLTDHLRQFVTKWQ